jgi:hypothetical protein
MAEEDETERDARHALEGRAQWATVEALNKTTEKIDGVIRILTGDETKPGDNGLVGAVRQIMGYLKGDYDEAGIPTDGALRRLGIMWNERNFVKGLALAALIALMGQLGLAVVSFYFTHVVQAPVPVTLKAPETSR